jgi:hypothetical protein
MSLLRLSAALPNGTRFRDATPLARASRAMCAARVKAPVAGRLATLGGHLLQRDGSGWRCVACKCSKVRWAVFAPSRCTGSVAARWAARAADDVAAGWIDGGERRRWLSDEVM